MLLDAVSVCLMVVALISGIGSATVAWGRSRNRLERLRALSNRAAEIEKLLGPTLNRPFEPRRTPSVTQVTDEAEQIAASATVGGSAVIGIRTSGGSANVAELLRRVPNIGSTAALSGELDVIVETGNIGPLGVSEVLEAILRIAGVRDVRVFTSQMHAVPLPPDRTDWVEACVLVDTSGPPSDQILRMLRNLVSTDAEVLDLGVRSDRHGLVLKVIGSGINPVASLVMRDAARLLAQANVQYRTSTSYLLHPIRIIDEIQRVAGVESAGVSMDLGRGHL